MKASFKYRSPHKELIDDPQANPVELQSALRYIHFVNRSLGGYSALISGLSTLIQKNPAKQQWNILDLGCGAGQELRVMQEWSGKISQNIQYTGLDISECALEVAKADPQLSNVSFICADALDPAFDYSPYDIVTGTLFFHHLTTDQIMQLVKKWNQQKVAVLMNDLHRSPVAWILFNIFARITAAPYMALHDGSISIQRAFSKNDLSSFATSGGFNHYSVQWRWAYRYLLLLWHEQNTG